MAETIAFSAFPARQNQRPLSAAPRYYEQQMQQHQDEEVRDDEVFSSAESARVERDRQLRDTPFFAALVRERIENAHSLEEL